MSAANRVIALDRILDAASRRRRKDMPGRYRYIGRTVTALVGLGQGLAAVAEAIGEADEHARHRLNATLSRPDAEELQVIVGLAWEAGSNYGESLHTGQRDEAWARDATIARLTHGHEGWQG